MIHFFPDIYPDELWYSVLCRYHVRCGNIRYLTTIHSLFRSKTYASISSRFPNNSIYQIFKQLPDDLYDISDIILNHTLFCYYSRFYEHGKKLKMLEGIKNGNTSQMNNLYYHINQNPVLKCCPECMKEDMDIYGETYWHLSHQIPLVKFCQKHKCRLFVYSATSKSTFDNKMTLPDECFNFNTESEYGITEDEDFLSQVLTDYQYLPMELGPTDGHNNLFQELLNKGYGKIISNKNISVDVQKVYKGLILMFGEELTHAVIGENPKPVILLRMRGWFMYIPERFALLATLVKQKAEINFSKDKIEDILEVKMRALCEKSVTLSKKEIAEQLGVQVHQIDAIVNMYGINHCWKSNEIFHKEKTTALRVNVTISKRDEIRDIYKAEAFPTISDFIRHCIDFYIKSRSQ